MIQFGGLCGIVLLLVVASFAAPPATTIVLDDFKDLKDLFPVEKMKSIAETHARNDSEFQAAIKYLQSKEWTDLVETIKAKPEWISFKDYLKQAGIDVDVVFKCITEFIRNIKIDAVVLPNATKSLRSFIIEMEQNIPTTKILAVIHEKLTKNPNFQALYDKLSSKESYKLVNDVRSLPEVKILIEKLSEMSLKLNELFSAMYIFFGWEEPQ